MRSIFIFTGFFAVLASLNALASPLPPGGTSGSNAFAQQILNSVLDAERNRQERIREIRDILRDLCREPPGHDRDHDHDHDRDHCKPHPASP